MLKNITTGGLSIQQTLQTHLANRSPLHVSEYCAIFLIRQVCNCRSKTCDIVYSRAKLVAAPTVNQYCSL